MKRKIKAVLLSVFVLPGLGQLYLGHRVKGGILILMVNIFILFAAAVVLRSLLPLILQMKASGTMDLSKLLQQAHGSRGVTLTLFFFVVLWAYGAIDAIITKPADFSDSNGAKE